MIDQEKMFNKLANGFIRVWWYISNNHLHHVIDVKNQGTILILQFPQRLEYPSTLKNSLYHF